MRHLYIPPFIYFVCLNLFDFSVLVCSRSRFKHDFTIKQKHPEGQKDFEGRIQCGR